MGTLTERIERTRIAHLKFFFGEDVEFTQTKFKWVHYKSDTYIVLATMNVRRFKGRRYVLMVDNDKYVNLQTWQVRKIKNWDIKENSYAVRLDKRFFKVKQLPCVLKGLGFDKEDTWDDLVRQAKVQDNENLWWKSGHYKELK